jgi:DNA invertase Pin-like site-specific DNA recombinase
MSKAKRAALYVRVSTDKQSVENQIRDLRLVAERRGWQVVEIYRDEGISGAKRRDQRPGLNAMLKDASRRKFDVVMAWALDRLGRSLIDLLGTIEHLEAAGVDVYLDQQSIDTTTPMGRLLFQITGAFAEFERSMIRQRIHAGLRTIKATIAAKGNLSPRPALHASAWAAPMPTPRGSRRRAVNWPRGRACSGPPSWWGWARCTASAGRCRLLEGADACRGMHARRGIGELQRVDDVEVIRAKAVSSSLLRTSPIESPDLIPLRIIIDA